MSRLEESLKPSSANEIFELEDLAAALADRAPHHAAHQAILSENPMIGHV
jgi:hypothetical protein